MNIHSVSNFANRSITGLDIRRRIFKHIPNFTIDAEKLVNKIGTVLSRPDVNRGVMGGTAILTQPFIDYYNPNVDRDTATVSTCRTIGKIIAGTAVGCLVRSGCYYATRAVTDISKSAPAWRKLLLPSEGVIKYLNGRYPDWLKNYRSVIATVVGLGAMLFTNVLIDVPLTNLISKALIHKVKPGENNASDVSFRGKPSTDVSDNPNPKVRTHTPYKRYANIRDKFYDVFFVDFDKKLGGRHDN